MVKMKQQDNDEPRLKQTVYSDVNAIDGRLTRLPCFVRPLNPSDSISLVLWYRGDDISGSPIYSVDARHQPFEYAQHFIHKTYQHKQLMNFTLNQSIDRQQQSINQTMNPKQQQQQQQQRQKRVI
ncbi:hemicentin-1-like isoform x1 [Dermatophagoides farinae]|uniref:Hemicentin-1-like isoform x1 n=1 Tax=Dermatophagoides farinae TaxID=6954 RepID=A0A9D4P0T8_DERFA|nr:hemicentin-1-like isoform x1 [Dermatophagoides farinae]